MMKREHHEDVFTIAEALMLADRGPSDALDSLLDHITADTLSHLRDRSQAFTEWARPRRGSLTLRPAQLTRALHQAAHRTNLPLGAGLSSSLVSSTTPVRHAHISVSAAIDHLIAGSVPTCGFTAKRSSTVEARKRGANPLRWWWERTPRAR